jgi:hypothetical protein
MNFIIPTLSISIMFIVFKIIDSKYITKDDKSLKLITKDGLVVFLSSDSICSNRIINRIIDL